MSASLVGSEMCIRDRPTMVQRQWTKPRSTEHWPAQYCFKQSLARAKACLRRLPTLVCSR
eukprot:3328569-Alexandrium_andersonii.AAC.1